MNIVITGCAGFIGNALTHKLLQGGHKILGVDSLSDFYSIKLKSLRLELLKSQSNFQFLNLNLTSPECFSTFTRFNPEMIVHLAAQPGVRLPRTEFVKYIDENIFSFIKVCEYVNKLNSPYFLYASSSSVYGNSAKLPFSEAETFLKPTSFYGSTKLLNEIFAYNFFDTSISHVGLRFFTVYGPFGRPDMAYLRLINSALNNIEFSLNGDGELKRDFTYIDDVVDSVEKLITEIKISKVIAPKILNIGGGFPNSMNNLINIVENITNSKIKIRFNRNLSNEMIETYSDFQLLQGLIRFKPQTSLEEGMHRTIKWILDNQLQSQLREWVSSSR